MRKLNRKKENPLENCEEVIELNVRKTVGNSKCAEEGSLLRPVRAGLLPSLAQPSRRHDPCRPPPLVFGVSITAAWSEMLASLHSLYE